MMCMAVYPNICRVKNACIIHRCEACLFKNISCFYTIGLEHSFRKGLVPFLLICMLFQRAQPKTGDAISPQIWSRQFEITGSKFWLHGKLFVKD